MKRTLSLRIAFATVASIAAFLSHTSNVRPLRRLLKRPLLFTVSKSPRDIATLSSRVTHLNAEQPCRTLEEQSL
jgi:hypothetical protein